MSYVDRPDATGLNGRIVQKCIIYTYSTRTCTRQFSMKILWPLLWEALRDKIILMGGSRQETL
jgi:hypothetical protein